MSAPIHPAMAHLPLALAVLLPLLSAGVGWAIWRRRLAPGGWWAIVGLALLLMGSAFVALRTGEQDEERAERFASESVIEHHEEAAEVFLGVAGAATALTLATAFALRKHRAERVFLAATVLAWVVVAGLAVRTGKAGGEVVWGRGGPSDSGQGGSAGEGRGDGD